MDLQVLRTLLDCKADNVRAKSHSLLLTSYAIFHDHVD